MRFHPSWSIDGCSMKRIGRRVVCRCAGALVETPVAQQSILRPAEPAMFEIINLARKQGAVPKRNLIDLSLEGVRISIISTDLKRLSAGGNSRRSRPTQRVNQIPIHKQLSAGGRYRKGYMMPVSVGDETAIDSQWRGEHLVSSEPRIERVQRAVIEQKRVTIERAVLIFAHDSIYQIRVAKGFDPCRDGKRESVEGGSVRNGDVVVGTIESQSESGVRLHAKNKKDATSQGSEKPEPL